MCHAKHLILICCLLLPGTGMPAAKSNVRLKEASPGIYEIKLADLVLTIDAGRGGRIISFRLGEQEMLVPDKIHPENYGSTLWLSPQTWKWPPFPVLDTGPYRLETDGAAFRFISREDSLSGCRITKTIVPDPRDTSFLICYEIRNISDRPKSVAPWEVTRVAAGGLTFFAFEGAGKFSRTPMAVFDRDGITWFSYVPEKVTDHQKLFRNGKGWLAHVSNGLLFLKQFPDIREDQQAKGEAEVELYVNKDRTYMELENQGGCVTLDPERQLSWKVKWRLKKIPASVNTEAGSKCLIAFTKNAIGTLEP
ncbi:MAG: hypothetical protein AB2L24_19335 [Mangrovibacterium sp.]